MTARMNLKRAYEEARKRWPNTLERTAFARREYIDHDIAVCRVGFEDVYSQSLFYCGAGKSWEAAFRDADKRGNKPY